MRLSATVLQKTAALLLSGLLGACTVVVDDGPDYRPRPDRPGACTMEYVPVCGQRGRDRQSFANACMADRQGYRIVHRGTCRDEPGGDRGQSFCTREYAPVCARRRGDFRTFPNACEARAADWRVVSDRPC
jgi:hypothetical protein